MMHRCHQLPRPTVIEGLSGPELEAVADVNDLELAAAKPEAEASDIRWQQAERVVAALDAGMSQRKLADSWRRPDGTSYSQAHVSTVAKTWKTFYHLGDNGRPPWNEAYHSPEVRKGTAERIVASENNERYTPIEYLEAARAVLGTIDLDPASCHDANERVLAATYYTAEDDGLSREWAGRVWLNPPYGRLAGDFIERLLLHHQSGGVPEAIALLNAHCTDTAWFQPLWDHTLCFTDHRIDFMGGGSGSTHGSVFVYLGRSPDRFAEVFSGFGAVVRRWP